MKPDVPGFQLLERIARGNVLDVYDAWSDERGCRCVVKTLRPDRLDDHGAGRRLLAEGRLLLRLCHPNVVRGYDVVRTPQPAVAMETLGGETLSHLAQRRRLTGRELAFLGLQLGSALAYLHGNGVLHLDLKPSNVVAQAGRAHVIDLSVARRPGRVSAGTGTWCYMAPEQARGGYVGAPADVWGLGVTLWEAACGDTPFGDEEVEYPQLERGAPSLRTRRGLPRPLADVVDRALAPDPSDRPTLAEVTSALVPIAGARG